MTLLTNASLSMTNTSIVFSPQSAYVSMELYYALIALFLVLVSGSFFLDGKTKPFEKLCAAAMAWVMSVALLLSSYALAIVDYTSIGVLQQINNITNDIQQQQAIAPVIVMQNSMPLQIVSWIIMILCIINIINCILVLKDFLDMQKTNTIKVNNRVR